MIERKGKTRIKIDYSKCGEKGQVDPRDCGKCMRACPKPVFVLHQSFEKNENPLDPEDWRITPILLSLCIRCLKCVDICPQKAITVSW